VFTLEEGQKKTFHLDANVYLNRDTPPVPGTGDKGRLAAVPHNWLGLQGAVDMASSQQSSIKLIIIINIIINDGW
jgi:hypothetical protein